MWIAQPLTTVDKVLKYLKDTESISGDFNYDVADRLVKAVSQWAERFTQGPIINQTITEKYSGEGQSELFLRYYPVISVNLVLIDGQDQTSNIDFYEDGAIFFKDNGTFPTGRNNIQVTYVAGYAANLSQVPPDIEQAVIQVCAFLYRVDFERYANGMEQPQNLNWLDNAEFAAVRTLQAYKRWRIGYG